MFWTNICTWYKIQGCKGLLTKKLVPAQPCPLATQFPYLRKTITSFLGNTPKACSLMHLTFYLMFWLDIIHRVILFFLSKSTYLAKQHFPFVFS
jgi:hypothetical protein